MGKDAQDGGTWHSTIGYGFVESRGRGEKGVRKLEESELTEVTPHIIRAMVPGINAALGTLLRSGQDRKNLEADHAFVVERLMSGQTKFRYRGLAMEYEAFADAEQEEIKRLVSNAVSAMFKADSVVDWSKVDLGQFNPEFRRRWISEASNVSDETLQDLWARLLAGELESPGSVSNDTMSIARDLIKERAEEFQTLCSAVLCNFDGMPMIVVGCGNPGSNSLKPHGLSYDVLMRLAHHRLIVNDMNSYLSFNEDSNQPIVVGRQQNLTWLLRRSDNNKGTSKDFQIKGILLTPAGKELFAVVQQIPNPAYTTAMLKALEQEGWTVTPVSNAS